MEADLNFGTRMDVRRVPLSEGDMLLRVVGTGPAILCLHGVSAWGRSWLPVAARLAERAQCWIPDLLGRGRSTPRTDVRYRLDDEVRRLEELCSCQGCRPVLVAGHSHGAALGLALSARQTSVAAAVLVNPVTPWLRRPRSLDALRSGLMRRLAASIFPPLRRPLARLILRRVAGPRFAVTAGMIDGYAAPYSSRRRAETLMRVLSDWEPGDLGTRLPQHRLRTRVIAGRHDPRVPVDSARQLAERLGATFRIVEDGGHILPEQHPDLVAREISDLLDELRAFED